MIFIILGSQKFQFNRLLKAVDALIEAGVIRDEIFAQIGHSDYVPKHYRYKNFLDREEFIHHMQISNIVISHGGTGAIISALKLNKRVLAVPRLQRYGEHTDDHQLQIVEEFTELNFLKSCTDVNMLGQCLTELPKEQFCNYQSNTIKIIDDIKGNIPPIKGKILVVSNMYPSKNFPSYGIFVERFCKELEIMDIQFDKSVLFKSASKLTKICKYFKFYLVTFLRILFKSYSIIYVHYASHSGLPVLWAMKFKKCKVYVNIHGSDLVPEKKEQEKMLKYTRNLLAQSYKIIVPSQYYADKVKNIDYSYSVKTNVYPSCGVNNKQFYLLDNKMITDIKRRYGISEEKICIGYVGRIDHGKGWDTFVKAIDEVLKSSKNICFVLVGSGSQEKELNDLIEEYQLQNTILRLPLLDTKELNDIYNILDIFVFPTQGAGESLGLVALEAMACKCIVLASDFAAPKYYVDNGVNGYKFEKTNHLDLANKIGRLLELNKKEIETMKQNAYFTANQYDNETIRPVLKEIICK